MNFRSLLLAGAASLVLSTAAFAQSVSVSPNPVNESASLAVTFADPHATTTDQIEVQDPSNSLVSWGYLNGTQTAPSAPVTSGTISFTMPASPAGEYSIYLMASGGSSVLAATSVVVQSGSTPPPPGGSLQLTGGATLAPSTVGDVVGVVSGPAFALVPPLAGPPGSPGAPGTNGTNAGQTGDFTPTSSTMPCATGASGFDASYIYTCYATNAWHRAPAGSAW